MLQVSPTPIKTESVFTNLLSTLSYLATEVNKNLSLPLNISEPGRVPKSFGKRVAIYFQLGDLERKEIGSSTKSFDIKEEKSKIVCLFPMSTLPHSRITKISQHLRNVEMLMTLLTRKERTRLNVHGRGRRHQGKGGLVNRIVENTGWE